MSGGRPCEFTAPDEPMRGVTPWRSAHMSILPMVVYQPRVGQTRLMHHCLRHVACFDADMFQRIFMRVYPQKGKSTATESGRLQCCRHSNTAVPGTSCARSISKF